MQPNAIVQKQIRKKTAAEKIVYLVKQKGWSVEDCHRATQLHRTTITQLLTTDLTKINTRSSTIHAFLKILDLSVGELYDHSAEELEEISYNRQQLKKTETLTITSEQLREVTNEEVTLAKIKQLTDNIRLGVAEPNAIRATGLSANDFQRHMKRGRQICKINLHDEDIRAILWREVTKARLEKHTELLYLIKDHAKNEWRAAAYLLERMDKQEEKKQFEDEFGRSKLYMLELIRQVCQDTPPENLTSTLQGILENGNQTRLLGIPDECGQPSEIFPGAETDG